jgi:hypothetical protein
MAFSCAILLISRQQFFQLTELQPFPTASMPSSPVSFCSTSYLHDISSNHISLPHADRPITGFLSLFDKIVHFLTELREFPGHQKWASQSKQKSSPLALVPLYAAACSANHLFARDLDRKEREREQREGSRQNEE